MVPASNNQDGPTNIADIPTSGAQALICGVCDGSGEIKYEYNFRAMFKTCEQCNGESLLNIKKTPDLEKHAEKDSEQRTRTGGAARVMSEKQR